MEKYTSYRFGAGRYLQEPDILAHSGGEICRYGKKVYVIGGPADLGYFGKKFSERRS